MTDPHLRSAAPPPRRLLAALLALATAGLSACSLIEPTHVGSGTVASELRSLPAFQRISVAGRAELFVRTGPEHRVQVSFDDNLLEFVETGVEHGQLAIELAGPARYKTREPLRVDVVLPRLEGLAAAGSTRVEAEEIDAERLEVSLAGSGRMRLAGRARDLSVSIAGSGDLDLRDLAASQAEVSITGSGDVRLQASDRLEVSIAGSGRVAYLGAPEVSSSIAGSGEVVSLTP